MAQLQQQQDRQLLPAADGLLQCLQDASRGLTAAWPHPSGMLFRQCICWTCLSHWQARLWHPHRRGQCDQVGPQGQVCLHDGLWGVAFCLCACVIPSPDARQLSREAHKCRACVRCSAHAAQPFAATDKLLQQFTMLGCLPVGFAVGWSAPASAAWPTQGQVRHSKGFHEVTLGGSGRKAGSAKRVSLPGRPLVPFMRMSPTLRLAHSRPGHGLWEGCLSQNSQGCASSPDSACVVFRHTDTRQANIAPP